MLDWPQRPPHPKLWHPFPPSQSHQFTKDYPRPNKLLKISWRTQLSTSMVSIFKQ